MGRKITKNNHQYKVSLPIELIRKLGWDESTSIIFHEVNSSSGKGLLVVKDKSEVIRLK